MLHELRADPHRGLWLRSPCRPCGQGSDRAVCPGAGICICGLGIPLPQPYHRQRRSVHRHQSIGRNSSYVGRHAGSQKEGRPHHRHCRDVVSSSAAREADSVLYTWAGPEIAVATTKAYSAQLAALYLIAIKAGLARGTLTEEQARNYCQQYLGAARPDHRGAAHPAPDRTPGFPLP